MKSYLIFIFLTIFSTIVSIMMTFGVFPDLELPVTIVYQFDESTVTGMVDGAMMTNTLSIGNVFGTALNALLTSLMSILYVYSLLICLGVPPIMAVGIQSIIYAVYVWDIVLLIFNRQKPTN